MHITEMGKIATKKTIIKLYFQTNHGIRTIAAMMNMKKRKVETLPYGRDIKQPMEMCIGTLHGGKVVQDGI